MNKMLSLFLKLFRKPEPKSNNYFESLIQKAEIQLSNYRNILQVCGKDQHFCNTLFLSIITFVCIICLCQLCISTAKSFLQKKQQRPHAKITGSSGDTYKRLHVNIHATSRPFGYLPGSKIYVLHPGNREDFILSDGKRSIGAQTIVSINANNMFIYGQMEQDVYISTLKGRDNADENQTFKYSDNRDLGSSNNLQEEDASSISDEATVIAKPSVLFKKPGSSRIPVIVRQRKSIA